MSETRMREGLIVLTDDAERQGKLRRKLAEYEARCAGMPLGTHAHSTFKFLLLKALLEEGVIDVNEFAGRYVHEPWYHLEKYLDAMHVIRAYNAGDLEKLQGGTGFA